MRDPSTYQRKPKVSLTVIDSALRDLGRQRRVISGMRRDLRRIEMRLFSLSGFHRHRQAKKKQDTAA